MFKGARLNRSADDVDVGSRLTSTAREKPYFSVSSSTVSSPPCGRQHHNKWTQQHPQ